MNCSLRSSAAEMPLPVRKGEKNQAINWESWGQLIPVVGAWAARHFPWVQLAAQGDPQVPLGWGSPCRSQVTGGGVCLRALPVALLSLQSHVE